MIQLLKLNKALIFVNPDLIRWIEVTPDTVITFTDGHQLMVRDTPQEIVQKIIEFRRASAEQIPVKDQTMRS